MPEILRDRKFLIGGLTGLVFAVLLAWFFTRPPAGPQPGDLDEFGRLITRVDVSSDTDVPDADSENLPANVAKPSLVTAGGQLTDVSYRDFGNVRIEGNRFQPDTIIVRQGDTMNMKITAVDRDYDFTQPDMGISSAIPRGETKHIQYSPPVSGKFMVFCGICGGPDRGPVGYIIVVPK